MTDLVSQLVAQLEDMRGKVIELCQTYGNALPHGSLERTDAALTAAKAGGWVSPYDSVPQPDQTVLVWSRQTWETAPSLKIDTWAMQREAPLSFSTATIETGYGWDDHEDFESVIAWQPIPAPPAQRGEG